MPRKTSENTLLVNDGIRTPTTSVRCDASARAARFGTYPSSFAALSTRTRLPTDSAAGFLKMRDAVIGLTPASLATSVSRILSGFVRFRPIRRSYHRHCVKQTHIDSATNRLLIEQLPKPYKLRTISVRPDFGSARSRNKNNRAVAAFGRMSPEIQREGSGCRRYRFATCG